MAKKLLTLAIAISLLFSTAGLTACNSNKIVETEYFRVELYKKEGYAVVLELTELGKEQEILAVPMFVEGLPVKQIGRYIGKFWSGWYHIDGNNLKKLYIPHSVEKTWYSATLDHDNVIVVNLVDLPTGYSDTVTGATALVHIDCTCHRNPQRPNVAFMYNYNGAPNQGYYWFDYVTGSNIFMRPPTPIREDHSFAGWYLEPELITTWNERWPQSADETLNLYAKWQEK
ncbi:MAG: InlB B-repeat-containing protein [Dehalococcoidia bacterium]|nr:InlB B-repeat-containing protein [Dehalococcoidia bacterium]